MRNEKVKRKMEKVVLIAMAAVIVSSLFGAITIPVSAAGEVTVTRTYVEGTEVGTAVVTVTYTVNTAIVALAIEEDIPGDWTIVEQTSDPLCIYKEKTHEWILPIPEVSEVPAVEESGMISFTVSGPAGAASTISGGYNTGEGYVDTPSTEVTLKGEDTEAPVVTSPTANPPSIPADAATTSQLNVTVTADSVVASVSIDLSAIGGSATAVMTNMGDNVYSVTTTAAAGTAGIYDLQVNATDIHGYSNTSVSIQLNVTRPQLTVSISTPDPSNTSCTWVLVNYTYTGDIVGFNVSTDNETWTENDMNLSYKFTGLTNIVSTMLYVRATNTSGQFAYDSVTVTSYLGDIDNDGEVGLYDLIAFAAAYDSKPGDANWNEKADFDGNNKVGLYDLIAFAAEYGTKYW